MSIVLLKTLHCESHFVIVLLLVAINNRLCCLNGSPLVCLTKLATCYLSATFNEFCVYYCSYHKFAKGKDLSGYHSTDLNCIFGERKKVARAEHQRAGKVKSAEFYTSLSFSFL